MKYENEFRLAFPETVGEIDQVFDINNYANWLDKEHADTLAELERVKKENQELKDQVAIFKKVSRRLEIQLIQAENERDELKKEHQDLHKRWLIAVEFIHSLAAGFPMSFWTRVQKAGEVLKKINP